MALFSIGIPTLNRIDLLMPCLIMYKRDFPDVKIYVLDNGRQNIKIEGVTVVESETNIGVAASWNLLCDLIFKDSECALILNDDIYLGKKKFDIDKVLTNKKHKNKFLRATVDWCAFILPKSVWQKVGKFDECFFPAYYEDKSYEYRMKLLGVPMIKTPDLNPYLYKSSQTLEKEPSLLEATKKNKQKYIDMWGGEPEREKFKVPSNEKKN